MVYKKYGSVFVQLIDQNTTEINEFNSIDIDMFPNPANNKVTLKYSTLPNAGTKIVLSDITGKQLLSQTVQSTNEILDIGNHNLPEFIWLKQYQGIILMFEN